MTKLEKLIQELCPNGVKHCKIKDIYKRVKGTPITAGKMKEIAVDDGEIKIFAGGKTVITANESDIPNANITRVPAVLVQSRGVIDAVYYDKPFTFKNEMWAYTADDPIKVKFLYYVLKNNIEHFRDAASGMGSLPQISLRVTEEFVVPVPPLPVQAEIVRILDNFTELAARKKQYEYYRDCLYDNNTLMCLSDCSLSIADGDHMPPPKVEFGVPFITISNITTRNTISFDNTMFVPQDYYDGIADKRKAQKGDILYTVVGSFGTPVYIEETVPFAFQRHIAIIRPDTTLLIPKYLYYAMQTTKFYNQALLKAQGAAQKTISLSSLGKMKIPVPPLAEQERIVAILDHFDTLCNNISNGLPAEIEGRQKQYEYYRDKLLTFTEVEK